MARREIRPIPGKSPGLHELCRLILAVQARLDKRCRGLYSMERPYSIRRAVASTSSIISSVNRPVRVFCWLG